MEDQLGVTFEQVSAGVAGVPEISPGELYAQLEKPNNIFLLDVRNDEEYASWKIEGRFTPETEHVFYGEFLEDEERVVKLVPSGRPVVVVCAKGGASQFVAEILRNSYGIPAVNLTEGMIGWGNYMTARLVEESDTVKIYQIARVARGCLSYVLISRGEALVIDPLRHIDIYLQLFEETGADPVQIIDTHAHADHISGGPALAQETGAPYALHPYDGIHPFDMVPAQLSYSMLQDGLQIQVGALSVEVFHVPGHTLGQVNLLAQEPAGKSYFFTGDTIFLQSFGRPDLGGHGETWASLVYTSIFEIIRSTVPGSALVLPGHFARHIEADERGIFAEHLSEIWRTNADLQIDSREEFTKYVLRNLPIMPSQYIQIKRVNAGLITPSEEEAMELELGKNVCALSTAYAVDG